MNTPIPKPRRHWMSRVVLPLLLLVAVAAMLLATAWSSIMPAPTAEVAVARLREVETDVIEDDPLDESAVIQAPGWVEAEPYSVYAGALAEGVVEDVLVLEGDTVTKGQPVAQLVADEAAIALRQQEAVLQRTRADERNAQAALAVIEARTDAARSGAAALADEHERKTALISSGAVAEGPVERLFHRLNAARAQVQELVASTDVARVAVDLAAATTAKAVAERDLAALRLDRMTVRSPIDGVVIERLISPGSVVRFGNGEHASHVVHLYDPTKLQVRADVPLADAAMVGAGQPAEIVVDLLPDTVFTGEVLRFVHRADLQKNTVEAKVRINAPSPLLKPDMLARVRILPAAGKGETGLRQRVQRVMVPAEAVVDGHVWVLEGSDGELGAAARRSVRAGNVMVDGWIELIDGVRPGERILLDATNINAGDMIRGVEGGAS